MIEDVLEMIICNNTSDTQVIVENGQVITKDKKTGRLLMFCDVDKVSIYLYDDTVEIADEFENSVRIKI